MVRQERFLGPRQLHVGSAARSYNELRAPNSYGESFGLMRHIKLGEKASLMLRGEFFNAFNRVVVWRAGVQCFRLQLRPGHQPRRTRRARDRWRPGSTLRVPDMAKGAIGIVVAAFACGGLLRLESRRLFTRSARLILAYRLPGAVAGS